MPLSVESYCQIQSKRIEDPSPLIHTRRTVEHSLPAHAKKGVLSQAPLGPLLSLASFSSCGSAPINHQRHHIVVLRVSRDCVSCSCTLPLHLTTCYRLIPTDIVPALLPIPEQSVVLVTSIP